MEAKRRFAFVLSNFEREIVEIRGFRVGGDGHLNAIVDIDIDIDVDFGVVVDGR